MKSSKGLIKGKKKLMEVITGIVAVALLVFVSGMEHPTVFNYVGTFVCVAWLVFYFTRRSKWTQ